MVLTKKEQIRKAAKKLFKENGYQDTSLRDISREAGVNVSSISYYFGTKEELYQELFPKSKVLKSTAFRAAKPSVTLTKTDLSLFRQTR